MVEMRWVERMTLLYCGNPVDTTPGSVLPCEDIRMYKTETERTLQYREVGEDWKDVPLVRL